MADEGRKRKMQRKKGANLMKNLFKKDWCIISGSGYGTVYVHSGIC